MAAREALVAERYSESWIEAPDDEADLPEKWFVIALTEHFTVAPSLGRQEPAHHVILEALLPGAGVSGADIHRLLHGDDLVSMATNTEIEVLADRLGGLRDFGGWLSPATIGSLSRELVCVRSYLLNIRQEQQAVLAHIHRGWAADAGTLARQAYKAAQAMLEFAQRRRQALFVVLD